MDRHDSSGDISVLNLLKIFLILFTVITASIVSYDAFATPPSMPSGFIQMEVSEPPVLGQEFDLTIYAAPFYGVAWTKTSEEKRPTTFNVILPKSFEIIDDDFSDGMPYYDPASRGLNDDYHFFSTVRDVGFPPQTTVKIKPTEPGMWQIIVESGAAFINGKIFVTLTENYSYIFDTRNSVVKRDACGKDLDRLHTSISMFDVESSTITRNIKNDYMIDNPSSNWNIVASPSTELVYVYNPDAAIILYESSGKMKDDLKAKSLRSKTILGDITINPETNLIYAVDHRWSSGRIQVLDGESHLAVSEIKVPVKLITVNSETNTLYAVTDHGKLNVIDLDTEEIVAELYLETPVKAVYDIEANSATNKIYVLNQDLHVIDGYTNSVEKIIPVDGLSHGMEINEQDNEIYLLQRHDGKLHMINGVDYSASMVNLHRSGGDMDFDHVHEKLYVPNNGGSITVIDTNTLEFDIMDGCSRISNISINSKTGVLSAIDEPQSFNLDGIQHVKPNRYDLVRIDNSEYPRTEYLQDEQIVLKLSNMGDADVTVDSVKIKNTNTGSVTVAFTELQTIPQNDFIEIVWDQTDSGGKQVSPDNYAVILKGHDDKDTVYETHKLLAIIDQDRLDYLQALPPTIFYYLNPDYDNSDKTDSLPPPDDLPPPSTTDDLPPLQPQSDVFSADTMCKNNPVLVTADYERFACVKFTTAEKLVLRGWEIVSTKTDIGVPDDS